MKIVYNNDNSLPSKKLTPKVKGKAEGRLFISRKIGDPPLIIHVDGLEGLPPLKIFVDKVSCNRATLRLEGDQRYRILREGYGDK